MKSGPTGSPTWASGATLRASAVALDNHGVFHLRTSHEQQTAESFLEQRERWDADPERAEARHELRLGPLEYEPLSQPRLPNALARIASAADTDSERIRSVKLKTERCHLAKGARRQDAKWLARHEAAETAERAAVKEIERFYRSYGPLGYQAVKSDESWPESGEPLGWIIAEAQTVRFVLEVIDALNRGDVHGSEGRRWPAVD